MSYQVLARKYRPKSFETLVGQEHVVRALSHALEQQRLHHAYLFTGTRGVGKTTLSRILAKSFNCQGVDGNGGITAHPCGVCEACTAIDAGRFVDYIEMDAASNRGVDEMASLLEQAVYAPSNARFKVYMIDEVHMLTNHAFNSMLKTLEEPPEHVKFILATTDPQKIPVTVLSRCLQFNLKQMPPGHIVSHLENILGQEQIEFEVPALRLLAQGAHGSMRDALSLTDQSIAYAAGKVTLEAVQGMLGALDQSYLIRLLDALAVKDGKALLDVADEMAARSLSYKAALQDLGSLLHQIAIAQMVPDAVADDAPEREEVLRLANLFGKEEIQLFYQIVVHGRNELALAPDEYAGFSMTLLRLLAFRPSDSAVGGAGSGGGSGGVTPSSRAPQRPGPTMTAPLMSAPVQASSQNATPVPGQIPHQILHQIPHHLPNQIPTIASLAPVVAAPTAAVADAFAPLAPAMQVAPAPLAPVSTVASAPASSPASVVTAIVPDPVASSVMSQSVSPAMSGRAAALAAAGLNKSTVGSRAAAAKALASQPAVVPVAPVAAAQPAPAQMQAPVLAPAPIPARVAAPQSTAPVAQAKAASSSNTSYAPDGMPPPWDEDLMEASYSAASNEPPPHFHNGAFDDEFDAVGVAGLAVRAPVMPQRANLAGRQQAEVVSADALSNLVSDASVTPDFAQAIASEPAEDIVRPAALVPIPELNWDGHWPNLAASLPMRGVAQQLAQQSELIQCQINGNTFLFQLRVPLQTLLSSGSVEKLEMALEERFSKSVKVETKIGAVEQTANAQAVAERAERQQQAENSIQSDSFIQSLMREFGATVVTGSIKPI
ncbi:DNA polymerase III subunit gamma/tau [Undibacterium sp. Rencai35W]|uniref:DNA polymerase III subunit gamma/tau n=1 Tax=Undibacterium sp. Rencai35W TaxID=3413046 RepID=UPI003BF19493